MNFIYAHITAVGNIALGFCCGIFATLVFQEFAKMYVAHLQLEREKHLFNQKVNRMVDSLEGEKQ